LPLLDWLRELEAVAHRGAGAIDAVVSGSTPALQSLAPYARFRPERYLRSLVYRSPRVEVLVLGWASGAASPVHDHDNQSCWMRVLAGALEVYNFPREKGEALGPPTRERLERLELDRRDALHDVHRVRAPVAAVSLHIYARPIDRCRICLPAKASSVAQPLRYDDVSLAVSSLRWPGRRPKG
jgi:predicted metal-dependent enzyme (double-stranded beta helix superfamily)